MNMVISLAYQPTQHPCLPAVVLVQGDEYQPNHLDWPNLDSGTRHKTIHPHTSNLRTWKYARTNGQPL